MRRRDQRIDSVRRTASERENHIIDEYLAGRIGRREFLRHATVAGMSLAAAGAFMGTSFAPAPARAASGTLRISTIVPAGAVDPLPVADAGGLLMLQQTGEFLANSGSDLKLTPVLAESWTPN